jgi:hypothetical protein
MLRSRNDDLVGVAVANGEHPCPPALTENGSRQAVETAVGHTLLDAGVADNVYPVTNLESLDNAGARRQTPLSQIFLELIPCFLSWTIVVCHFILPPVLLQPV